MTLADLVQRVDEQLDDAQLLEVEANLSEDGRRVVFLVCGRGTEWIGAGADLKCTMRPHVFRRELQERLEAWFVAELALWRTGYSRIGSGVLSDEQLALFHDADDVS